MRALPPVRRTAKLVPGVANSSNQRLGQLDALRGLAALTVILGHFCAAYVDETKIWHGPKSGILAYGVSRIFTSGHQAVLLFFLLSGFVLALPAVNGKPQPYEIYITRRIFRIYVPYLAALALAVLGNYFWHGPLGMTRWADSTWAEPVHWAAVRHHILFIGNYNTAEFNTAFWSLVIEMRISILFPLLCLIVLRAKPWFSILAIALITGSVWYLQVETGMTELQENFFFGSFFIAGILLAQYRHELVSWTSRLRRRVAWASLVAALLFFWYGSYALQIIARVVFKMQNPRVLAFDWMSGIGSVALMILSLSFVPFGGFLMRRIPQFLGKISYSIYLVHSTVLFALLHLFGKELPAAVMLAIYVPVVLVLSAVLYRFIEKPAMEFGHYLGHLVDPRLVAARVTTLSPGKGHA